MSIRRAVLGTLVTGLLIGGVAGGLPLDGGSADAASAHQGTPSRRAIVEALACLANLSPRELQGAAQQHGGLISALEAHGVGRETVLDELTALLSIRFEAAVAEGRLSDEQAKQLARQKARRVIRRLGRQAPARQR